MLCHERRVGCPGSLENKTIFPLGTQHSGGDGRARIGGARSHGKGTGYRCKGGSHRKVNQSQREPPHSPRSPPGREERRIMTPFETLGPEDDVSKGRAEVCIDVGKEALESKDADRGEEGN